METGTQKLSDFLASISRTRLIGSDLVLSGKFGVRHRNLIKQVPDPAAFRTCISTRTESDAAHPYRYWLLVESCRKRYLRKPDTDQGSRVEGFAPGRFDESVVTACISWRPRHKSNLIVFRPETWLA